MLRMWAWAMAPIGNSARSDEALEYQNQINKQDGEIDMLSTNSLIEDVKEYYSDTLRTREECLDGLRELQSELEMTIDALTSETQTSRDEEEKE